MERQSANTACLHRNLYVILKFAEQPKTLGSFFKNMVCSEGDELLGDGLQAA